MNTPRGIRNNNPGNIETGANWQGLADPASDGRFCKFTKPVYGIRAIARILITYRDRHGIRTIHDAIARWAPPEDDNPTVAYANHVAAKVGVGPHEPVDLGRYEVARPLVEAIILHENGQQPYTDAQIDKGLVLAGIEPPEKGLAGSRTVKGGQVAAAGGIASVVAGVVEQAEPALPFLQSMMFYAPFAVGAIVVLGVGWMLWARLDDRRKGLR